MEELLDKLDSGQKKATVHLVMHYSTVSKLWQRRDSTDSPWRDYILFY